MIQLKTQQYLDLEKYDHCIQMDASQLPYAHSWYLNAVSEQWDCLVLNDYDAVWPLPFRTKWGIKYYFRPFGIQQLGVYSKKPLSPEILMSFQERVLEQAAYADIYLNEGQQILLSAKPSINAGTKPNFVLALKDSYEAIYQGFNSNLKRKLKKAAQEKLQLFENDSAQTILQLFKEQRQAELGLSESFFKSMEQLLFQLMHKGLVKVLSVYGGPNQLIAGAVFLEYRGRAIFLLSALDSFGKENNAMAFLINEYLIFNSDRLEMLDFEGSENPGLAQFYQSFGAKECAYSHFKFNRLPWPLSWLKR